MTRAGELRPEFTGDGEGIGIGIGIGMIWAEARGAEDMGAIGRDGGMPWHLPEDLAHFKSTTWGAPVIMGRRTWESLPERFRPLPGRENIVVTRDASYAAEGATAVASLEEAVARTVGVVRGEYEAHLQRLAEDSGASCQDPGAWPARAAWIIGGGRLYRAAMPIADELVVTKIELDVPDADTFAPEIGPEWELVDPGSRSVSKTGLAYRFERWVRR